MSRIVGVPQREPLPNGSMPGGWWHEADTGNRIICDLCPRACSLKPGDRGFCFVRENVDGEMILSTYGRSTGFCVDPIEKKPLNHFLPGTAVLSFGTAGCNLGCKFCQNWDISKSREVTRASEAADPETIAEAATRLGCHSVAFTYNDPVIWAEYAVDTARACHANGLQTVAVTAGYITPEARSFFFDEIDAANVDLKAFGEEFYQQLTYSHLQPVLDTLVWLKQETDVWFEITNLMIPRENDSPDEVRRMCQWIVENLGDEVPVHFTAFHPDFRMQDHPATPLATLLEAYQQAKAQGIKHVYVGNVHDPVHDSTYCPHCSALLIQRNWHELEAYHLQGNRCHCCGGVIAGRFLDQPGTWGRRRQPVRIADYASPAHRVAHRADRAPKPPIPAPTTTPPLHDCESAQPPAGGGQEPARSQPLLTERQEQAVFQAACNFIVAGVSNTSATLADPTLDGAADISVMGAFVTLKRQGHLRACCGTLGHPMPLIEALQAAAYRTATDDQRFPPISTTELLHLDVDVSLLHSFRTVESDGADRISSIEIGRHGLTIRRAPSSGLLLPNVAVENNWDSETFLRQVCRKAGLPSSAWQDGAATLQTFESLVINGTIDAEQLKSLPTNPANLFTTQELNILSQHCRTNVLALLQGATPNYYIPSCSDRNVHGVLLTLDLASSSARPQFAKMSMRPDLPLQSTLFQLCETATRWFQQNHLPLDKAHEMSAHVAVLHDSATHGTVAQPELRGIAPQRRVLAAVQHGRFAWRFAPSDTEEQLLNTVCDNAQIFDPQTAGLFSFAVDTNIPSFLVNNVAHPLAGPAVRMPAVAGVFYPGTKLELEQCVEQLIAEAAVQQPKRYPAILVPHAGLRFSGRIAAAVYQRVAFPDRIIILAPKHTRAGTPWAVAPHTTWSLPGLQVDSDPELAGRLSAAIPRLQLDAAAHRDEHAIEVQLPLLAHLAPHAKVVGITIGEGDFQACAQFANQLASVLREETNPPLLVISTDLNHYATDSENRRLDRIALDALQQLDPALLFETVRQHDISMCGLLPAVIVLQTLRVLDVLHEGELVDYATSADAGGSVDRVVGYAGMLFE